MDSFRFPSRKGGGVVTFREGVLLECLESGGNRRTVLPDPCLHPLQIDCRMQNPGMHERKRFLSGIHIVVRQLKNPPCPNREQDSPN